MPRKNYATHGVDKYPAKMVPHLARYAIERTTPRGGVVYDPFCGCGTVLVESLVSGRNAIGVDVNPFAVLLAKAKSLPCRPDRLRRLVADVVHCARRFRGSHQYGRWLSYWFSPLALTKLNALRTAIHVMSDSLSSRYQNALWTILALAVRGCSKADPRSPKPFISKKARVTRCGRHHDPFRTFCEVAERFATATEDLRARMVDGTTSTRARLGDARRVRLKPRVDAVVTSPPYLSAQDYYRSSKLELAVIGHDVDPSKLGRNIIGSGRGNVTRPDLPFDDLPHQDVLTRLERKERRARYVVETYLADMQQVLHRVVESLKDGGRCCIIIGDSKIRGVCLPVHTWVAHLAGLAGLRLYRHEIDAIRDRRVPPSRQGHDSVIRDEHLLFLRKPRSASG